MAELKEKGIAVESEGCAVIYFKKKGGHVRIEYIRHLFLKPIHHKKYLCRTQAKEILQTKEGEDVEAFVIEKSDKTFLYSTTDLAALKHRCVSRSLSLSLTS